MYRATIAPEAAVNDPALAPYFTGPALQLVVTSAESSPDLEVRAVFFGRGVRSRWHRHPYPQIVVVLSGVGLLGIDNAEQQLRPGVLTPMYRLILVFGEPLRKVLHLIFSCPPSPRLLGVV